MSDDELYRYLDQTFEWSRQKALRNVFNHGVRFTEAATVFFDEDALAQPDEAHSEQEERYTVIGRSVKARELFVVHVFRGERIRIIRARKATPDERRDYEARLGRRL